MRHQTRRSAMPSFRTIYRAVVMIAIVAIGAKAWQFYGPNNEQVKSTAVKIIDIAHAAWNKQRSANADSRLVANPPSAALPVASTQAAPAASTPSLPPALTAPQPFPAATMSNAA